MFPFSVPKVFRLGPCKPRCVLSLWGECLPVPQVSSHQLRRKGSIFMQRLRFLQIRQVRVHPHIKVSSVTTTSRSTNFTHHLNPCGMKIYFSNTVNSLISETRNSAVRIAFLCGRNTIIANFRNININLCIFGHKFFFNCAKVRYYT